MFLWIPDGARVRRQPRRETKGMHENMMIDSSIYLQAKLLSADFKYAVVVSLHHQQREFPTLERGRTGNKLRTPPFVTWTTRFVHMPRMTADRPVCFVHTIHVCLFALARLTYTERTCCGSNYTNAYTEPTCSIAADNDGDNDDGDVVSPEESYL